MMFLHDTLCVGNCGSDWNPEQNLGLRLGRLRRKMVRTRTAANCEKKNKR
jgi:hypothetical protein